ELAREAKSSDLARELLHGYTSCLTLDELQDVALRALSASPDVLRAVRTRLTRLGKDSKSPEMLDSLAARLMEMHVSEARIRVRIDSLLSLLYPFLSPTTREHALGR